jgi:hypothetical protein
VAPQAQQAQQVSQARQAQQGLQGTLEAQDQQEAPVHQEQERQGVLDLSYKLVSMQPLSKPSLGPSSVQTKCELVLFRK